MQTIYTSFESFSVYQVYPKVYSKRKKDLYFYLTMIAKTIFSFFPCGVVIIISSITSFCFFKKTDLFALL